MVIEKKVCTNGWRIDLEVMSQGTHWVCLTMLLGPVDIFAMRVYFGLRQMEHCHLTPISTAGVGKVCRSDVESGIEGV